MGLGQLATLGYLASSVVFNSLNTIVYVLLYPKFSQEVDPDYSNHFSVANVITQVLSAVFMPLLGSVADETRNAKLSMIVSSGAGIAATFSFLPIRWWSPSFQPEFLVVVYVLAMFLLRVAALNQNTLLGQFPRESRTTYSLGANLIGFLVNLVGLLILTLVPDAIPSMYWIAVFAAVATVAWVGSLFSPSQKSQQQDDSLGTLLITEGDVTSNSSDSSGGVDTEKQKQSQPPPSQPDFCTVLWLACIRVKTTVVSLLSPALRPSLLFLLAYFFFSVGGTSFSVFISVYFTKNFTNGDTKDSRIEAVNFYFKLAMVFGVLVGMGFDRWMPRAQGDSKTDVLILLGQAVVFSFGYVALWSSQQLGWGYEGALAASLVIGANYGWNMSVSRAVMSRVAPAEKLGELMGFFSTVTYAAMALVSLILVIVGYALPDVTLPLDVVLFCFALPGYVFLLLLFRHLHQVEETATTSSSCNQTT